MKYIITESQLELLSENEAIMWVKRRINKDILGEYVREAEMQFPLLCEDFGDEFEYSDNVIRWAVDDFLTTREDMFLDDLYDSMDSLLPSPLNFNFSSSKSFTSSFSSKLNNKVCSTPVSSKKVSGTPFTFTGIPTCEEKLNSWSKTI